MKIPETNTNIGSYYGTDEHGQWQPNGVIVDSAGAAGGDAGFIHHPGYPVPRHVPQPGYVMAGAYYEPGYAAPRDDFEDYMWMENEEEFDKQVMQQLEEEALMEQCIEAMLEDERRERGPHNGHNQPTSSRVSSEQISRSTLNPLAAEFVPTFTLKEKPAEVSATEEVTSATTAPETEAEPAAGSANNTKHSGDESQSNPTEVSETNVDVTSLDKRPRDSKKDAKLNKSDAKKSPSKTEVRTDAKTDAKADAKVKAKTPPTGEIKITAALKKEQKREVKTSKSLEQAADESCQESQDNAKSQSPSEPAGFKPFNYAAAAKAKPKKATSPPVAEKPVAAAKSEKPVTAAKSVEKVAPKEKKPAEKPRKNSAK